jgi:hypothetical protein
MTFFVSLTQNFLDLGNFSIFSSKRYQLEFPYVDLLNTMDVEEMKQFLKKRRFKAWLIANG